MKQNVVIKLFYILVEWSNGNSRGSFPLVVSSILASAIFVGK